MREDWLGVRCHGDWRGSAYALTTRRLGGLLSSFEVWNLSWVVQGPWYLLLEYMIWSLGRLVSV